MGLHIIDVLVVVAYLFGMIVIGKYVAKGIRSQGDFYLAGRRLGRILQFFLHFGAMTDASGAPNVASEINRRGASGAWLTLQYVFITPFFWFSKVWWRRARVVTLGDMLDERFQGQTVGFLYAVYAVLLSIFIIGFGNVAAYKTMAAIVLKPETTYSSHEQQQVELFERYQSLKEKQAIAPLSLEERHEYRTLHDLNQTGQIRGFISYLPNPLIFYLVYSIVVGLYMIMGGFMAAVITDTVQGVLIVVFSFVIIPFGIAKLGGLGKLGEVIAPEKLSLFGTAATSDYTWYSILAILGATLVGYFGAAQEMITGGSARDEFAARLGAVTGGFAKRLMIVAWVFCGLIGLALYGDSISDPDMTWGILTRNLLAPGFIGLMLAGILAANMSTIDAGMISSSALFVRNIYAPLSPERSERHYVLVGRIAAGSILLAGVILAMISTGLIPLFKMLLTLPTAFGAIALLMVFWRRLTRSAVIISASFMLMIIGVLPYVLPAIPGFREWPSLTVTTDYQSDSTAGCLDESSEGGSEYVEGRESASIYFEKVVRIDPEYPRSALVGLGRFHTEIYIVNLLGLPVETFSKAGLVATRFAFCALVPFALLTGISLVTKPTPKAHLDRFYVKLKTPVAPTAEEDATEVQKSMEDPARYDHQKLFPNSNWEFGKWTRVDWVGFLCCWVAVGIIIGALWLVLNLAR